MATTVVVAGSSDPFAMMSRPQIGIDRLPVRRPSNNDPKEAMNCKSCRKRKVRTIMEDAAGHSIHVANGKVRSSAIGSDQAVKLVRSSTALACMVSQGRTHMPCQG